MRWLGYGIKVSRSNLREGGRGMRWLGYGIRVRQE